MELDARTKLLVQISAAAATGALAALRTAVTDAKKSGITVEEIRQTVTMALEIQAQTVSHSNHLLHQLLREPVRKPSQPGQDGHGPSCTCGHHHHS